MKQEEIKTEYLQLLQKKYLTDKDIQRGKQLVSQFKRNLYWDKYLKQYSV